MTIDIPQKLYRLILVVAFGFSAGAGLHVATRSLLAVKQPATTWRHNQDSVRIAIMEKENDDYRQELAEMRDATKD